MKNRLAKCVLLALIGCANGYGKAYAQRSLTIADETKCARCELRLERVVSIGSESDPELLVTEASVLHLGSRYFVTGMLPSNKILVFDSTGSYVQTIGRTGEGPGEFRSISHLVAMPGDSFAAFDDALGRASVWSISGKYHRSFRTGLRPIDIARVGNGDWILAATSGAADRIGYPIHHLSDSGVLQPPIGPEVRVVPSRPSASQRMIGSSPTGVWISRPDRYELEHWDLTGKRTVMLDREAMWFPDREVEGAVDFFKVRPVHPWFTDIHVDASERVWTIVRVHDSAWRPASDQPPHFPGWDRIFDTIVEVIDPSSGVLLGSARLSGYPHSFTNDGLVVTHRETELGLMILDVWRPILTLPRR